MHPANQMLRKPDKLSQGAHNQTSYPRIQWENTLDKKGPCRIPDTLREWETESKSRGECKVKDRNKGI